MKYMQRTTTWRRWAALIKGSAAFLISCHHYKRQNMEHSSAVFSALCTSAPGKVRVLSTYATAALSANAAAISFVQSTTDRVRQEKDLEKKNPPNTLIMRRF